MPIDLDETHDVARRSWVESANAPAGDFPIQNLPFGVFRAARSRAAGRVGIAIGDSVLDVVAAAGTLGLTGAARDAADACRASTLNTLASLGRPHWKALRRALFAALLDGEGATDAHRRALEPHLHPIGACELLLPFSIGDYTDFYSSKFHATNVGRLFRPDNPLLPNYAYVPIGYHGRASSVIVSETPFARPRGQIKAASAAAPTFAPTQRLDYEVELGFVVGPGNALGAPIPIARAREHLFGAVMLCDWSARDVQAWEYQPLGPFLAKSFATTISPWVVTLEALAPFACPAFARGADEPPPLPYLHDAGDQAHGGFEIDLHLYLTSEAMRAQQLPKQRLSLASYRDAFWTPAQLLSHHASNGCNLVSGDLLGTGTISGAASDSFGSLLELTRGGTAPIALPGGETRVFLADGDEITQRARCTRQGFASIGFGSLTGRVLPAR
jgi:fumarylacetoacetase